MRQGLLAIQQARNFGPATSLAIRASLAAIEEEFPQTKRHKIGLGSPAHFLRRFSCLQGSDRLRARRMPISIFVPASDIEGGARGFRWPYQNQPGRPAATGGLRRRQVARAVRQRTSQATPSAAPARVLLRYWMPR